MSELMLLQVSIEIKNGMAQPFHGVTLAIPGLYPHMGGDMALHLTKVAFGAASIDHLAERLKIRAQEGPVFLTTRYLPKRHEEVAGQGSLFWILKHQLVARSPILSFGEAEGGR